MTDRIFYSKCPSCYSIQIAKSLSATDHTVSHELFEIWHCSNCSLRFTQAVPDQDSIGRFYRSEEYISHTDTNKGIVNRMYRFVRGITVNNKRNIIHSHTHLSKGNLLDLGAGTGAFAVRMAKAGWTVSALEPDEQARKKAADLHSLQLQDSSKLFEFGKDSFDAITLWHVLEHVHALHEYLERIKEILKPGGILFIAVPNYISYDAAIYKEYWAAYDTPRHLYHFSPEAMQKLAGSHGLQVKKIRPMWFDSFYVSLLSEKYKTGHSNLIKGFWNGAISNIKALSNNKKASSLIYIISK
ncbi:MAG: class I SAM-dependent methyltransferase [Chitinophagaceae bacterium]|nr:class I SAM-dependent methyltransferase [Chitinophagaceae bacterium]